MSRTLRWFLAASLALNMLAAGIAMGWLAREWPPGPPPPSPPGELSHLPEAKQRELEGMLEGIHTRDRELAPRIDAKRQELMDVMRAETFDEDAFRQKNKELGALFANAREQRLEDTIVLAKGLNREERGYLAQHLRKPPMPPGPPPQGP